MRSNKQIGLRQSEGKKIATVDMFGNGVVIVFTDRTFLYLSEPEGLSICESSYTSDSCDFPVYEGYSGIQCDIFSPEEHGELVEANKREEFQLNVARLKSTAKNLYHALSSRRGTYA